MIPEKGHLLTILSSPSLRGKVHIPYSAQLRFARLAPKLSPSACRAVGSAAASLTLAMGRNPGMTVAQIEALARAALSRAGWNASINIEEALFATLAVSNEELTTDVQLAQQTYTQASQMQSNIMKSFSDSMNSNVGNLK
jgi:hypothetical protein